MPSHTAEELAARLDFVAEYLESQSQADSTMTDGGVNEGSNADGEPLDPILPAWLLTLLRGELSASQLQQWLVDYIARKYNQRYRDLRNSELTARTARHEPKTSEEIAREAEHQFWLQSHKHGASQV